MFKRIFAGDRERVLVVRSGRFETILAPGDYWIFDPFNRVRIERFEVIATAFVSPWAPYIAANHRELAEEFFTIVETSAVEVALIYADGHLIGTLSPDQRQLFWKGPVKITAQVINVVAEPQVSAALLPGLAKLAKAPVTFAAVEPGKAGLLMLENLLVRTLAPGSYGFWNPVMKVSVEIVDLRTQLLEVPGQEILTKDKVSLRVNIVANYKVADAAKMRQSVKDGSAHLYSAVQRTVRQSMGSKTLEEILADKVSVDLAVFEAVSTEMAAIGVEVQAIAIKDIVLPGEVREILNHVVTAERQAQANLIRRREETAATRSLLNTANLMKDNPILIRLKELETLERLTEKVDRITVNEGLEGLLHLVAAKPQ